MSNKFTPGDWYVEMRKDRFAIKTDADSHAMATHRAKYPECKGFVGQTIAETHIKYNGSGRNFGPEVIMGAEEAAANAQLMSAAPAMAKALVRALAVIDALMPGIGGLALQDYKIINDAPLEAWAALKKAGVKIS